MPVQVLCSVVLGIMLLLLLHGDAELSHSMTPVRPGPIIPLPGSTSLKKGARSVGGTAKKPAASPAVAGDTYNADALRILKRIDERLRVSEEASHASFVNLLSPF